MIRKEIKECHKLTEDLGVISSIKPENLTDEQYDEILKLLEKRGRLLSTITEPYTLEEKQCGSEIIKWNKQIDQNLSLIKKQVQLKIKNLKKKEQSAQRYIGYDNSGANSFFYDKRN